MSSKSLLLVGCFCVFGLPVHAADWPQWCGPQRDGHSKETGLLKEWPKDGPKLLWQVKDIGLGYGSPVVVGGKVYLIVNRDKDEFLLTLDPKDGKELHAAQFGKVGPNKMMDYAAARSTPTVEGDFIYCLSSDGDLVCLTKDKGEVKWQKNLRSDFEGKAGFWAYAESPLIDGDVLVCTPGGNKATLVALNKKDGSVVWKCEGPDGAEAAYTSVNVTQLGDSKQYVQMLKQGLVGVDVKTGKLLWSYEKTVKGSPAVIPTPVAHDGFVYSSSARVGGGAVKVKTDKDTFEAEQVYFEKDLPTSIGGTLRVGDYLYGTTMDNLLCLDFKTGKVMWKEKCIGAASLLCADGLLFLHGEDGQVALVEATPDAYREKGKFAPPDQPKHPRGAMEKAWTYPTLCDGKLYIRDQGVLWCYEVKEGK